MTKARDIASATTPNANAALLATFPHRNLIINGAMQVAQRGTSFTSTGYSLDRWYSLSGRTTTQDSDVPSDEFLHSLKIVSSGNKPRVFGSVELSSTGSEHPIKSSTDYTLSGWVKGTSGESFLCRVAFANGVGQGDFRQISPLTLTTLSGSWQYFTATFNSGSGVVGVSDNCVELFFRIDTNDTTFSITGIQLELGSTATPFEHRSYGDELARCQRYCTVLGGSNGLFMYADYYSTDTMVTSAELPVTMRTTPSITQTGTGGISNTGFSYTNLAATPTLSANNPQSISVYRGVASSARTYITLETTGELTMEAEL